MSHWPWLLVGTRAFVAWNFVKQSLPNECPQAKSSLIPIFVNKFLLEHSTPIHLYNVYSCFCYNSRISKSNRPYGHKVKNIYRLALLQNICESPNLKKKEKRINVRRQLIRKKNSTLCQQPITFEKWLSLTLKKASCPNILVHIPWRKRQIFKNKNLNYKGTYWNKYISIVSKFCWAPALMSEGQWFHPLTLLFSHNFLLIRMEDKAAQVSEVPPWVL